MLNRYTKEDEVTIWLYAGKSRRNKVVNFFGDKKEKLKIFVER